MWEIAAVRLITGQGAWVPCETYLKAGWEPFAVGVGEVWFRKQVEEKPEERSTLMPSEETFSEWAILEIMGHVRLAGRLSEHTIAGTAMLRLDIPASAGQPGYTRFFGGSAVYSISPVSEEIARAVAARSRPEPVQRFELQAPAVAGTPDDVRYDDPYDDPDEGYD